MNKFTAYAASATLTFGALFATQVMAAPTISSITPITVTGPTDTAAKSFTFKVKPAKNEGVTNIVASTPVSGSISAACSPTTIAASATPADTTITCGYTFDPTKKPLLAADTITVKITYSTGRASYNTTVSVPVSINLPAASKK